MQVDGQSHLVHSEEAVSTRLQGLTCLLANKVEPSTLLNMSPAKRTRHLVADANHAVEGQAIAETEVRFLASVLENLCRPSDTNLLANETDPSQLLNVFPSKLMPDQAASRVPGLSLRCRCAPLNLLAHGQSVHIVSAVMPPSGCATLQLPVFAENARSLRLR